MNRAHVKNKDRMLNLERVDDLGENKIKTRRKPLCRSQLTAETISQILEAIEVQKLSHQEIRIKFNVKAALVTVLKKAHKRNPEFLAELRMKEKQRVD